MYSSVINTLCYVFYGGVDGMEVNLAELIEELLDENKHKGFDARLKNLGQEYAVDEVDLLGKFFYLPFRSGEPTVQELIDYLYEKVVYFCIPRSIREIALRNLGETRQFEYAQRLLDEAKNLFITAGIKGYRSGEPGELILFILLEAVLGAPQIVSKMYLKTSEEMPVHGCDAIHVSFDESTETLCVFWGESKMHKQLSSALDDTCESIVSFREEMGESDRPARRRDIDIIRDHADIKDGAFKEALMKYFDPYEDEYNKLEECHACFVGFDYSVLSNLHKLDKENIDEAFRGEYSKRAESAMSLFADKIRGSKLNGNKFVLFLLPFIDVEEFRQRFFNRIGQGASND